MTVYEVIEILQRRIRRGEISPEDDLVVRNPDVSEGAMEAGIDGYFPVEEILNTKDGRVVLLGESDW